MRAKDFNTGLRGVLFEARHHAQMGAAVWLYGWLVLRQTRQAGATGLVLGGRPVSYREIEGEMGLPRRALERWMRVLRRAGYVEKPLPMLPAVTELVHAVGGVAVAAHLGDHGSEGQIREFQAQGLDGLEVRHPSHSPGTERRLSTLADRLGLAVTGGSDWHGDTELGDAHAPLGGLDVPPAWLDQLEARRPRRGAPTCTPTPTPHSGA